MNLTFILYYNIYIVIFTIYSVTADYELTERLKIGTVLFNPIDLDKQRWDSYTLDLLHARKHFDNVIPSPRLVDTVNEEYLDYLLEYFNDSYKVIETEVNNPVVKKVMKNALSDTIGGYLKGWILPISKYSYYGGTISLEKALKLNQIYDAIKRDLKTDGKGWRKPDEDLLKYVPINIAVLNSPKDLHKAKPASCEDLAYYEKSNSGYTLPLPLINWEIDPSTMFVPLKNQTLIPLNSINSPTAVIKYYDLIQCCVNNMNIWRDFDERFQTWLITDVAPHLNDDELYIPFGGILSLVNKTRLYRDNYKKTFNGYNIVTQSPQHNGLLKFLSGKKLILAAILLIEIVWCIPTLLYILFSKKSKRKAPCGILFFLRRRLNRNTYYVHSTTESSESDAYIERTQQINTNKNSSTNFSNIHYSFNESRSKHEVKDEKYFNTISYDKVPSKNVIVLNESKPLLQSNSCKVRPSHHSQYKDESECKSKEILQKTKSRNVQIEKNKSKTSNKTTVSEEIIQNYIYSQFQSLESQASKSIIMNTPNENSNAKSEVVKKELLLQKPHKTDQKLEVNVKNDRTLILVNNKSRKNVTSQKQVHKNNDDIENRTDSKRITVKAKKKIQYKIKQISLGNDKMEQGKNTTQTTTTLQIEIQNPNTEINLGITNTDTRNNTKPSKIPMLSTRSTNKPTESLIFNHKPPINILNKCSFDDSNLNMGNNNSAKLNVTL